MSFTIFGIVQGRLTQSPPGCLQWFPQESWQDEYVTASDIGINYIELIAEVQHNSKNPIWTDDGIEEIKQEMLNESEEDDNDGEHFIVPDDELNCFTPLNI